MPAANSADATDRERLSIRTVRPRNVGAALAHRGLLHQLRQHPRRRAGLSPGRVATYPSEADRGAEQRHEHVGDAARTELRSAAAAFSLHYGGAATGWRAVVGHAAALWQPRRLCRAGVLLRLTGNRGGRLTAERRNHHGAGYLRDHLHGNRCCARHAGTAPQVASTHRAVGGRVGAGGCVAFRCTVADAALGARVHGVSGGAQSHGCPDGDDRGHGGRFCLALCLLCLSSGRADLLLPVRCRPPRHQYGDSTRTSLLFR